MTFALCRRDFSAAEIDTGIGSRGRAFRPSRPFAATAPAESTAVAPGGRPGFSTLDSSGCTRNEPNQTD